MFLVAGTFFPIDRLPEWAQVAAWFNPLYHCVQLVRGAAFGFEGWVGLAHLGILLAFGLVMWRLAIWRMDKRLVTSAGRALGHAANCGCDIGAHGRAVGWEEVGVSTPTAR